MAAMAALIASKVWFLFIATVELVVGSPTTEMLESVDCLLKDCERCFPNAVRNMAQNLIDHIRNLNIGLELACNGR